MLEKKYCRKQEPFSERWENICREDNVIDRTLSFKRWGDIISLGKDDLLIKTFGKPTAHIIYSNRNKVWGFKYQGFDFFFFRSIRGDCLQVEKKTTPKAIHAFIKELHREWKVEVAALKLQKKKWRAETS